MSTKPICIVPQERFTCEKIFNKIFKYAFITCAILVAFGALTGRNTPFGLGMVLGTVTIASYLIGIFVVLPILGIREYKKRVKEARKAFERYAGNARYLDFDEDLFDYSLIVSGIAYDGHSIIVMDKGYAVKLDRADIRSWTWRIEGYSTTQIYGKSDIVTSMKVIGANRKSYLDSLASSGFFIEVADIDNPVWQFMSCNERVLRRWDEILRQIDEGKLAVAA